MARNGSGEQQTSQPPDTFTDTPHSYTACSLACDPCRYAHPFSASFSWKQPLDVGLGATPAGTAPANTVFLVEFAHIYTLLALLVQNYQYLLYKYKGTNTEATATANAALLSEVGVVSYELEVYVKLDVEAGGGGGSRSGGGGSGSAQLLNGSQNSTDSNETSNSTNATSMHSSGCDHAYCVQQVTEDGYASTTYMRVRELEVRLNRSSAPLTSSTPSSSASAASSAVGIWVCDIQIYLPAYEHTYIHTYTHTLTLTYIYIYTCVCTYTYTVVRVGSLHAWVGRCVATRVRALTRVGVGAWSAMSACVVVPDVATPPQVRGLD
jgi:hypothetical protein